ncbi:SAM-dependent methyltransferase [Nitrospira sp.]|nr:SAM-dependent methyltransferase [Nitrospira sp.]
MSDDPTGRVFILPEAERRIMAGHCWVYDRDVASVQGMPKPGDVVQVVAAGERNVGLGLYSPQSRIRARLITTDVEPIGEAFWAGRLHKAIGHRAGIIQGTTAYRLVHAEADGLPGVIVDRYGETLVMQTLTVGMDRRKELLAELLQSTTGATAVYARNDAPSRALEGLALEKRFVRGEGQTRLEIQEGPSRFLVDVEEGQKTGWFCDQRENRLAVATLSKGKDVLDAFCHTGAFGVHAAVAGARSVAGLDRSRFGIDQARTHAELNQVRVVCDFRVSEAIDAFKKLGGSRKRFDLVILDPPPFAKRRAAKGTALDGYEHLHSMALSLVREGGLITTCSCSHHIATSDLEKTMVRAARRMRRHVHVVERRGASLDHPIVDAIPETSYLSCLVVGVDMQ